MPALRTGRLPGTPRDWDYFVGRGEAELNPYRTFTNNCHHHASAVLQRLGI